MVLRLTVHFYCTFAKFKNESLLPLSIYQICLCLSLFWSLDKCLPDNLWGWVHAGSDIPVCSLARVSPALYSSYLRTMILALQSTVSPIISSVFILLCTTSVILFTGLMQSSTPNSGWVGSIPSLDRLPYFLPPASIKLCSVAGICSSLHSIASFIL